VEVTWPCTTKDLERFLQLLFALRGGVTLFVLAYLWGEAVSRRSGLQNHSDTR
jgi:hypothetical protein